MRGKQVAIFDTDVSVTVPIQDMVPQKKGAEPEVKFEPPSIAGEDDIEIIPFSMTPPEKDKKPVAAVTEEIEEDEPNAGNDGSGTEDNEPDNEAGNDTGDDAPPDSSSSSPYLAFAKVLYEGGALTQLDEETFLKIAEEKGDTEALIEVVKATVSDVFQSQFNRLPLEYKQLFQAANKGIPLKDALNLKVEQDTYSSIKDKDIQEDEALAERLVRKSYELRGFSKEEIEQDIKDAKDMNKLTAKALSAHKYLVKHTQDTEIQKEKEAERTKQLEEQDKAENLKILRTTVASIDKILPGTKATKQLQDKLFDMLTTPVKQDPDTGVWLSKVWAKRAEDPAKFDTVLAFMIHEGLMDGRMDSLVRKAKSDAVSQLDKVIKSGVHFTDGKAVRRGAPVKKEDAVKALEQFRRKPDY